MKICSKNDIKLVTGIMAASMLLGGCSVNTKTQLKADPEVKTEINLSKVSDTEYDKDLMDELYRDYCFNLFGQTVKNYGADTNVMISPASVMMALDMVAAGSKEESLKQLTDLFAAGQGPLTQQAYAAALMDKINGAKDVDFSCANAVWSNKQLLGDKVNLEYIDYIQKTFSAEYTVANFNDKTVNEINKWVDKHTNHMIDKAIDQLDPATVMVLVNAIAFEGEWETPYEDFQVKDGDFRKAAGGTQNVKFLNGYESNYYETEKASGFMKSYKGGKYAFLTILPKEENINANEFAKSFTAEDYEKFIKSVSYDYDVTTKIPEFKSDFNTLLNDILEDMGCRNIFHTETSDLSGIAGNKGDLFVSKVIHKTHIEVDAKGTKASAVTIVAVDGASAMPVERECREVICDRPFVYAIIDTETMAPVFIGTVNEI